MNSLPGSAAGGRSLLSRTLSQFALCALVCLLLTAPLFYLLTRLFYAEDLIEVVESVRLGRGVPPSIDLEEDIVEGLMLQFVLIFAVISVAMFITLRFATRRLWRPFDDSLRKAEAFNLARGEMPVFLPTDISEFRRLNASLEALMLKDRDAFRSQKEFTENASHELQTPIAVIRSKLDLLMQEDLTERQLSLVADLYGLSQRMGHLNRNLLLLAKIDNAAPASLAPADVLAAVQAARPLYEAMLAGARLTVRDLRSSEGAAVMANAFLLESLLKNLIVNAIRHSPQGGEVSVEVADGGLCVSNDAADGCPLPADALFRRFSAGYVRSKGNGLGLAIVKAICDFHGWHVGYAFVSGRHCFSVSFAPAGG